MILEHAYVLLENFKVRHCGSGECQLSRGLYLIDLIACLAFVNTRVLLIVQINYLKKLIVLVEFVVVGVGAIQRFAFTLTVFESFFLH